MVNIPRNNFKEWLKGDAPVPPLGSWLMSSAPSTAEALGYLDFEFLVLDMEHVPVDLERGVEIMRAISATGTECLVRLPWNDRVIVKRTLDAGAINLMFPFIQSAEEAAEAIAATQYPPKGVRGAAAIQRGSHYGTIPDYFRSAESMIANVMQIETAEAIDRIDSIAGVAGVDALFLGPGDLSVDLGVPGEVDHPVVQERIKFAAERCSAIGVPCGIVGGNPELVKKFIGYGFNFVAISSDMAMMMSQARSHIREIRDVSDHDEVTSGPY